MAQVLAWLGECPEGYEYLAYVVKGMIVLMSVDLIIGFVRDLCNQVFDLFI